MDFVRAAILGIIQALTEFLPISSSAHLILFRNWLGFDLIDGLTFDVAVHMGTVIALVLYFRADIGRLLRGFAASIRHRDMSDPDRRMPWFILAATIPAALVGGLFSGMIEDVFRRPSVIVFTLAAGGVLFLVVERYARRGRSLEEMTLGASLLIGAAQTLALVPGVSRSGITIAAGMSKGLGRADAARFSFLLSIPIMVGAGLKKALDIRGLSLSGHDAAVLAVAVVTSAAMGWLVIRFLLRFLQNHRLNVFAYYRFALAAALLVWLVY
jgi:undecaprenyl-diphosphatase